MSQEGFPYQSSIHGIPKVVERLEDGEKAEVNGFSIKGPASIWRKSVLREASVCVFGADKQTSSKAFSKDPKIAEELDVEYIGTGSQEQFNETTGEEVNVRMDINELKEKHPELVKQIADEAVAVAESKFAEKEDTMQAQVTKLSDKVEKQDKQILQFEKNETKRREGELRHQADRIWDTKLSESDVAERLYSKIRKHVDYNKFVNDDVLDVAGFSEAVDAEIKEWEKMGATSTVLGAGSTERELEDGENHEAQQLEAENDDLANDLLGRVGQKSDS